MRCINPYNSGMADFPCGQCLPCRINKRREWMHRLILEGCLHTDMTFLTLTYDDARLEDGHPAREGNLVRQDVTLFLKRLRKSVAPVRLRFFLAGEYGEVTQRPHYHLALFGYKNCAYGQSTYTKFRKNCCTSCDHLRDTWGLGHITCGSLEPDSMQYIAGYVIKKMTSIDDPRLKGRPPEFRGSSLGLGAGAMDQVAQTIRDFNLDDPNTDVPSVLRHGRKLLPLGRYLKRKLRVELGRSPDAPASALNEIKAEMQDLRKAWEQACSEKFIPLSTFKRRKMEQGYKNLEARQKLFRKDRNL